MSKTLVKSLFIIVSLIILTLFIIGIVQSIILQNRYNEIQNYQTQTEQLEKQNERNGKQVYVEG